jgi:hypothetical protein
MCLVLNSKEMTDIFKNIYYLKRYSHMYGPHDFKFNKKYIKNIEHIFKINIDHDYIYKNIKKIKA